MFCCQLKAGGVSRVDVTVPPPAWWQARLTVVSDRQLQSCRDSPDRTSVARDTRETMPASFGHYPVWINECIRKEY